MIYCFRRKKNIDRNDCDRCYLYDRICKNLYKRPYKCFESGDTLSEYEIEDLLKLAEEVRKTLMLSTKEVMKFLIKKYNLEIDQSLIFRYAKKGLITKKKKEGGPSKGVRRFWEDSAPYKIFYIKQLLKKYELTIKEISKYKDLVYKFNELEIAKYFSELPKEIKNKYGIETDEFKYMKIMHNLNRLKFERVIKAFACAEVGYDYGLEMKAINDKVFVPVMSYKKEAGIIKSIHVKIVDINILGRSTVTGESIKNIKAYKEKIYSKESMEKIA